MYRARAALPVIAAFFCSSESERVANAIQQAGSRINTQSMVLAVNAQSDWDRALDFRRLPCGLTTARFGNAGCISRRVCSDHARGHRAARREKKLTAIGVGYGGWGAVVCICGCHSDSS